MASKTPKLTAVLNEKVAQDWLAETIQEKVAKESAGFVQIEKIARVPAFPQNGVAPKLVLTTSNMTIELTIEVSLAR